VIVFAVARFSSLSGLSAITAVAIASLMGWFGMDYMVSPFYTIPLCALMFYTHRANIQRLLQGTERNFRKENP